MKRPLPLLLLVSALGLSAASMPAIAAPAPAMAPTVAALGSFNDGFRFGMSHAELTRWVSGTGGVIDHDYDPQLRHAAPGVQQRAIETERDDAKRAFERSLIEFGATPSGLDSGPLAKEYTYGNRESAMVLITPLGKRRYFFFIQDRLWKVYDEVPFSEGGPYGKTFAEAEAKVATKLATPPRHGAPSGFDEMDWQDQTMHLRLVDRSAQGVIGVVLEDRATLNQLASLRTAKIADPFAIDPAVLAVTKEGLSDPNKQAPQEPPPDEKTSKKKKKR